MKVMYKTMMNTGSKILGDFKTYVSLDLVFCCESMENMFNDRIRFADAEFSDGNTPEVCVAVTSYGDSTEMFISYCPFCGEKIECIEAKRVAIKYKKRRKTRTVEEAYEVEVKP